MRVRLPLELLGLATVIGAIGERRLALHLLTLLRRALGLLGGLLGCLVTVVIWSLIHRPSLDTRPIWQQPRQAPDPAAAALPALARVPEPGYAPGAGASVLSPTSTLNSRSRRASRAGWSRAINV